VHAGRLRCSGARCSWPCGAGAAAEKVESRVRYFAGVAVSPYNGSEYFIAELQPPAGPRAAVDRLAAALVSQRLLPENDRGAIATPRTQLAKTRAH
jgi:hypothetical protein